MPIYYLKIKIFQMKKNKKGETLVWVLIWLIIFSIISLSIINIVSYNKDLISDYENINIESILRSNSDAILKKLDLSWLKENDIFYIYKNNTTKNFEIQTWTTNSWSKYIDLNWNKIDNISNIFSKIYKREFYVKKDTVNYLINPTIISNLVLYLDWQDIDWDWNSLNNPSDNSSISSWIDKSTKWHNATQSTTSIKPLFKTNTINWFSSLLFDWTDDYLEIPTNDDLNTSSTWYSEKSFAITFKTGTWLFNDVQVLYQEWNDWNNYSVYIENSIIKAQILWSTNNILNLWPVFQNNFYSVILVQDSSSSTSYYKKFTTYLNWNLIGSFNNIDNQPSHNWNIFIWRKSSWKYFNWNIGEIVSWNHALSPNEVYWISNYFNNRWNSNYNTFKINSVIENISKYILK